MTPRETLLSGAGQFGLTISDAQLDQFDAYSAFLLQYNRSVNLTAITEPGEVAIKHFVDSIALLGLFPLGQGARVIDVGTGAGFPGVPLKILRPDLGLTLLDSLQKRLDFLSGLLSRLCIEDVALVHARAEQAGADPALRERFDIATARAVAPLAALCEFCLPLVAVGGTMLAPKGPGCEAEVQSALPAIGLLGGGAPQSIAYTLPDGSGRTLVAIEKVRPTDKKYPRQRVKISKNPLG